MKSKLLLIPFLALIGVSNVHAQCATIVCPSNISIAVDSSSCDAIVSFTDPIGFNACNSINTTFSYTGTEQTWIVPAGVTSITVNAYGAQGGANWVNNDNFGGQVQAELAVTPGTTIYIYVGEQPTGIVGGWNGGGNGESAGAGGGGSSDIRIGGNTLNDRVIVGGAGGGGGYWSGEHIIGGAGGGLVGANGSRTSFAISPGGEGGTQTGSGNGTCVSFNNPICTGGFGYGGAPSSCGCEGYGGGSGWWGGAGSGNCRGGGGGSSYTDPLAINVVHTPGVRVGNGEIVISYPNNTGATTSLIAGLVSGSTFPVGTTTNTYQVISGGDTAWCSFDVIVIDTIIPSIQAPSNVVACGSEAVNSLTPTVWDNCASPIVNYTISGATTGGGMVDASGTTFNTGLSTLWYYVSDNSGNIDSVSMTITIYDLPTVTLDAFVDDTLCTYSNPITLPAGTPSTGIYSGSGVSGVYFDPSLSGAGTHWIVYSYADANGCVNTDSSSIMVDGCAGLEDISFNNQVTLYPNPANDHVTVNLVSEANAIVYSLHSADGKTVISGSKENVPNFEIDLSHEKVGVYFLHLNVDGNSQVLRILKQ